MNRAFCYFNDISNQHVILLTLKDKFIKNKKMQES